jgi:23S rRNA (cytosine1962-C5)-methyltransferase
MLTSATFTLLESSGWQDYELIDSGDGQKLERFGAYTLIRPEVQAIWSPLLSKSDWGSAHAIFKPTGEESGGHWDVRKKIADRWQMTYPLRPAAASSSGLRPALRFWVMTTPGRHLGVFPEAGAQWDFVSESVAGRRESVKVLNLFGYTGLATLAAAAAGAQVTHVDASRKSVDWARQNQALSKLDGAPIRWIVDDALKFVLRELRRGARYEGIIIEPPKFGRGPRGEIWEVYKSLPRLIHACHELLSAYPLFMMLTMYAVRASAVHVGQIVQEATGDFGGRIESGELVTRETSAGRLLSHAAFARWSCG